MLGSYKLNNGTIFTGEWKVIILAPRKEVFMEREFMFCPIRQSFTV